MWRIPLLVLVLSPSSLIAQSIVYVDADASGANDGSSWKNAFIYLQDGLAVATTADEVWVAEGVYRPDQGAGHISGDRLARFVLVPGVQIYGGFDGSETQRSERPRALALTVLSGDLNGDDVHSPTSRQEPSFQENSETVVGGFPSAIGGFTVTGGSSLAIWIGEDGAGCHVSDLRVTRNVGRSAASFSRCLVSDVEISQNVLERSALQLDEVVMTRAAILDNATEREGGGVLFHGAGTTVMSNSLVRGNSAGWGGGLSTVSRPIVWIVSTRIIGNRGTCGIGGLLVDEAGHLTLVNTLLAHNVSDGACGDDRFQHGGGAMAYKGTLDVYNSTIVGNSAPNGSAALAFLGAEGSVANTIIASNSSESGASDINVSLSDVTIDHVLVDFQLPPDGFTSTTRVVTGSPEFLDPNGADSVDGTPDDDFGLVPGTIGTDAGASVLLPTDVADVDDDGDLQEPLPLDIKGTPRVVGDAVDLGAFESPPSTSTQDLPDRPSECRLAPYPNPASDQFVVSVPAATGLEVFDALGRRVEISTTSHAGHTLVSVRPIPKGIYTIVAGGSSLRCRGAIVLH